MCLPEYTVGDLENPRFSDGELVYCSINYRWGHIVLNSSMRINGVNNYRIQWVEPGPFKTGLSITVYPEHQLSAKPTIKNYDPA